REWPVGPNGPTDRWQISQRLVLRDLTTGELVTWVSQSHGGKLAIGEFLKSFVAECRQHPGLAPVIVLTSYDPPTNFGDKATPRLKFVGEWQPFGPDASPPSDPQRVLMARHAMQSLRALEPLKPDRKSDMEDEIPF